MCRPDNLAASGTAVYESDRHIRSYSAPTSHTLASHIPPLLSTSSTCLTTDENPTVVSQQPNVKHPMRCDARVALRRPIEACLFVLGGNKNFRLLIPRTRWNGLDGPLMFEVEGILHSSSSLRSGKATDHERPET